MRALVTGGAGFIGSHIVDALVDRGDHVRVLDDLNTGVRENVNPGATLIEGSVADECVVRSAVQGCDVIFHQAAHKAVLRSVEHPLTTDVVNTHGTLTVLKCALDEGVKRVVHASSSSVYGGASHAPTREDEPLYPRSPYAVTKLAAEHYCRVFRQLYGLETVALRYFNVYGPRQRPDTTYAAVIPLFVDALLHGRPLTIHGDRAQSRDFTYIGDVVRANLAAAEAPAERCAGNVYNIAPGKCWSLLDLIAILGALLSVEPQRTYGPARAGDVILSQADATAARQDLAFECEIGFEEGLGRTLDWFRTLENQPKPFSSASSS